MWYKIIYTYNFYNNLLKVRISSLILIYSIVLQKSIVNIIQNIYYYILQII